MPAHVLTKPEYEMSLIIWIVLGLISGFIASKLVNNSGEGMLLDILLGIVGSGRVGGLLLACGMADVTGMNVYSVVGSVVVAGGLLIAYHALCSRRA